MLRIRNAQFQTLEHAYRHSFEESLLAELRGSYPEVFGPLPEPIALRMVSRVVGRAESERGLSDEAALRYYVHYCAAVGPDFDEEDEIREGIERELGTEEGRLAALCETVPDAVWDTADERADMTRWFDDTAQGQRDRDVALLAWAMPRHFKGRPEVEVHALIDLAIARCPRYGFAGHYDALTLAACMAVYGVAFDEDVRLTWTRDVFQSGSDPVLTAELLRLRVQLDTGCSI